MNLTKRGPGSTCLREWIEVWAAWQAMQARDAGERNCRVSQTQ